MKIFTLLITASFALGLSTARAADKAAEATPAAMAKRVATELFADGQPGLLSREDYPGGTQLVAVVGAVRYTVCSTKDRGALSFYARPNGSAGDKVVEIFSDRDIDGAVDMGSGPDGPDRSYYAGAGFLMRPENRPAWQTRYEAALGHLCSFLDKNRRR